MRNVKYNYLSANFNFKISAKTELRVIIILSLLLREWYYIVMFKVLKTSSIHKYIRVVYVIYLYKHVHNCRYHHFI